MAFRGDIVGFIDNSHPSLPHWLAGDLVAAVDH